MDNVGDVETPENPIFRLENHFLFGSLPLVERMLDKGTGIIWITGLSGSGKTTTEMALAWELCRTKRNVLWRLDPETDSLQEFPESWAWLKNIASVVSRRSRIKDVLQADTEVLIMSDTPLGKEAGEMIDAVRNGLVVISVFDSDLRGLDFLEELASRGIERDKAVDSTIGIISQTLVPRICPECRHRIDVQKHDWDHLDMLSDRYGLDWERGKPFPFFEADGCEKCHGDRRRGQVPAFEVLCINEELRRLMKQRAIGQQLRDAARRSGWVTMKEYLLGLALEGKIAEQRMNVLWSSLDTIEKGRQALEEKNLSNLWARWFRKERPFEPIPQPYIVGNPIRAREMFYGREDDFQYARQRLEPEQRGVVILLLGKRRCGKSSVLFQILNGKLGEGFLPILIEMQHMGPLARNDREFYLNMARTMCDALDREDLRVEGYDFEGHPARAFENLIDDVQRMYEGKRLVFMFDEYVLLDTKVNDGELSGNVILFLTSLLEQRGVSFIFTGSPHLQELRGEHSKMMIVKAVERRISFLSRRDTLRLIQEPVEGRVYYARGVPEAILRLSGGHPYYTQVLCQSLVDRLNDEEKNRADREDLEKVVEDEVEHPKPQMLYAWEEFSSEEKVCLSLLADVLRNERDRVSARQIVRAVERRGYPLDLPEDRANVILETLFEQEVLDKRREGYRFRMDLWRRWVARAHSIWQVLNEVGLASEEPIEVAAPAPGRRKAALLISAISATVVLLVVAGMYLSRRPDEVERGVGVPRTEGDMLVESYPSGAEIYLDGDSLSRGITSRLVPDLSPGPHRVALRKEGYVSADSSVEVYSDSTVTVRMALVEKRGTVFVRSDPSGAEVYVDGRHRGSTPGRISLSVGSHSFLLRRVGYREKTLEVGVIADSTVEVPVVVLQKVFGGVVVRSNPPGAEVYVDREATSRGTTPKTLELTPGSYIVLLRKKGYAERREPLTVVGDRTETLEVVLAPLLARLSVISPTSGAEVYLDGEHVGQTPSCEIPDLSPGPHRVRVEREGYDPVERPIEMRAGEDSTLTVTLVRQYGYLELVIRPWGRVWIDGEGKGTSPIGIQKLGVGKHTVRLTHTEYEDTTMTIVIPRKGETVKETIRLTKKKQ